MGEFDLIAQFFTRPVRRAALGVGDDCALLAPAPGMQLAVSSDMLVEGRHFFAGTDPERLGHKALAVNLSDLAACGAKPLAFTLALALPQVDTAWPSKPCKGASRWHPRHWPPPASGWKRPRRVWRWGWRCAAWPPVRWT